MGIFVSIYALFSYIKQTALTTTWRPDDPLLTFGILSDAKFLNKSFNLTISISYLLLIIFLLILQYGKFNTSVLINNDISQNSKLFIYSYGIFLFLNILYANFDYRIPIIFPLVIYLLPYLDNKKKLLTLGAFLLMPFEIPNLVLNLEVLVAIIGKVLLYYFFSIVVRFLFYEITTKGKKNIL